VLLILMIVLRIGKAWWLDVVWEPCQCVVYAFGVFAPHPDAISSRVMDGWANVPALYSIGCFSYAQFLVD
jgi:hypothetical protein